MRSCERMNCAMQTVLCNTYRYAAASTKSGTSTSCISGSSINASTSSSIAFLFTWNLCNNCLFSWDSSTSLAMATGSTWTRNAWPSMLTCKWPSEVRSSTNCKIRTEQLMRSCRCMPCITTGTFKSSLFKIWSTTTSICSGATAVRRAMFPGLASSFATRTCKTCPQTSAPWASINALSKAKQTTRATSMYSFFSRIMGPILLKLPQLNIQST
mmetsp:Transcript_1926/g.4585  ORF Transcript_1926/g.4585 Transcript_1926/m.4585 type:complete len:213 (-) Transcript_1926:543-1181(-)